MKIAFLGAGNIAFALVSGLVEESGPDGLVAADPDPAQGVRFTAIGVDTTDDNRTAADTADIIVISVKPNIVYTVLAEIAPVVRDQLIISVAAGVPLGQLSAALPGTAAIVRCMPNTPALVQTGMTVLCPNGAVSSDARRAADRILGAVGSVLWVDDEAMMDAVTAVSGSGPAYFFLLMEAMIASGERLGLPADVSRTLVAQTALGAATMVSTGSDDPGVLRQRVTSPGGTTEAAINRFLQADYPALVDAALTAARDRSIELTGG